MGFFDALNGGLETMFQEIGKSKKLRARQRDDKLKVLETTPFLLDSAYLLDIADGANKQEGDLILDYLYRFHNQPTGEEEYLNILGIESYREVENKIINKRWK
jgi:hypothetical protein